MVKKDEAVRRAKDHATSALLSKSNVQGVVVGEKVSGGRGTGKSAVVVLVSRKVPVDALAEDDVVPSDVNGVPTDVLEVGRIDKRVLTAMPEAAGYQRARAAGIAPGDSCGHPDVTAGTIGALVMNGRRAAILSNNHVLANENLAKRGDPILAPGPYDGGEIGRDQVGELSGFLPITFSGGNAIDAAIADVSMREVSRSIRWLGVPRGARDPELGDRLIKFGRTTDLTTGRVIGVNATVLVGYDHGVARFEGQILTGDMSDGGDSGSVALDDEGRAAALLFAGSSRVTVYNPISAVLSGLGVIM